MDDNNIFIFVIITRHDIIWISLNGVKENGYQSFINKKTVIICTFYHIMIGYLLVAVLGHICACLSFNVDTKTALIHEGPQGSMFGFKVVLHKSHGEEW